MSRDNKIVNLFCIYTAISIAITAIAWSAVWLNLISVAPFNVANISSMSWLLSGLTGLFGLYTIYKLKNMDRFSVAAFLIYLVLQFAGLTLSYLANGWIYSPGAGSQGTIPALFISAAMFYYLVRERAQFKNFA
ncbi:MAG: hypothetical protein V4660_18470 [Pseudomonadota bacterium]